MRLLTVGNPKTALGEGQGYLTAVLHFAPANLSGVEVCHSRTRGCTDACLNTAGQGGIGAEIRDGKLIRSNTVQEARIRRTRLWAENPEEFAVQLRDDILAHCKNARRRGMIPAVRLNGTSDIAWEDFRPNAWNNMNVFELFRELTFYDYTKRRDRMLTYLRGEMPDNYYLTFSRAETQRSHLDSAAVALQGGNVAVVFATRRGQPLPAEWNGFRVIDGDLSDLRFLDPRGVIVGLRAKGKAKGTSSGFVVQV